jgi:hypothetical protein
LNDIYQAIKKVLVESLGLNGDQVDQIMNTRKFTISFGEQEVYNLESPNTIKRQGMNLKIEFK